MVSLFDFSVATKEFSKYIWIVFAPAVVANSIHVAVIRCLFVMTGLEKCKEGVRIDCVRNYGKGKFVPAARQEVAETCWPTPPPASAAFPRTDDDDEQGAAAGAGAAGLPGSGDFLGELKAWEAAAAFVECQEVDEEDVFGHTAGRPAGRPGQCRR